jgi:hypothetical protein
VATRLAFEHFGIPLEDPAIQTQKKLFDIP